MGTTQYLTFTIAGEEYAVGILQAKEIIEYNTVTTVPSMPPWIRGVINLRGNVVPVVDLAVKFGLAQTEITKWTCIVITEVMLDNDSTIMGILVDSVSQVIDLGPEDIEEPPSFGSQIRVEYIVGMGKLGDKFALMLDIDRVLAVADLVAVDVMLDDAQKQPAAETATTDLEVKSDEADAGSDADSDIGSDADSDIGSDVGSDAGKADQGKKTAKTSKRRKGGKDTSGAQ